MYKRVDDVIREREEYLKSLRADKGEEASVRRYSGKVRTVQEFNDQVNAWNDRRLQEISEKKEIKDSQMMNEVKSKPDISDHSKKLSKKVNKDPVFERLATPKKQVKADPYTFIPKINNRSHSISRDQGVHERLYTPRVVAKEKTKQKVKTLNKTQKELKVVLAKNKYRVNTSLGTINSELPVNELSYESNLSFMARSLINPNS